jgi:hypothetical protein
MGILIHTHITTDLIIVPITGHITGTAGIDIIAIVTPIIGTSLIGIARLGWLEAISSQPKFLPRTCRENLAAGSQRCIFLTLARPPV